jgi:release factor glutamine methyltransferase
MTVQNLLAEARQRLAAAGGATPRLDAELLLAHAMGIERGRLLLDRGREVSEDARGAFERLLLRRAAREPVSHILGEREFWSLPFAVNAHVLDPRPDSETLIEAAVRLGRTQDFRRILDLGTGSGCLLVSLLHEFPRARGVGVDKSIEALRVAKGNAVRNGVAGRAAFIEGDWDAAAGECFDLIVSNPPYIPTEEIKGLSPEVRDHEPHLALDGGATGLCAYQKIVHILGSTLAPDGVALLEIGLEQGDPVSALAAEGGLQTIGRAADLAGIERCIILKHG